MQTDYTVTVMFEEVLMCRPDYFKVTYKINPWMSGNVDEELAMEQWQYLRSVIQECGKVVSVIEQSPELPDMVFSCNSGIVVYLSNFRHSERQGERQHFKNWFLKEGYEVFSDDEYFFEGCGDASFSSKDLLWAGYGFRSEKAVYDNVCKLGDFRKVLCELVNERFYHMDVCFSALSSDLALWYPKAFSEETQKRMKEEIELIEVSDADANNFACNALAVDKTIILPTNCTDTRKVLENYGYQVKEVDMSEFMKSGGAVQCLVLKLYKF
ncbi:Uncharacterized protein T02_7349 [Trichinella nativa]|uniref:Amidinotransferase n=1 Tax=Trichinella nativa TaxID=6335 RepID=A0A0V1LHJ2_9BILA|nr:Uncharacterized protein T06_1642 [Trichinella sp. T6]KRZ58973.1 Uncharacterized protein T02_7349 [Trichinella nativa]